MNTARKIVSVAILRRLLVSTTSGIAVLVSGGNVCAQTITDGLVGYWPMDNTQGTELTDHTATTNHGAFANGSPAWVTGKFGNAMDIDQLRNDHASIPHHAAYNANNKYSMSFWYYPIQGYRDHGMINKGYNAVRLGSSNNYAMWESFGSPWSNTYLGFSLNDTTWHHLVIIYDPSAPNAKQVYVDGSLVATGTTDGVGSDAALNTNPIGFNPNNAQNGSFRCDDFAIWDRAITPTEISYLYNGGAGNIVSSLNAAPSPPNNLVATASDQSVILAWDLNTVDPDVASYSVYRGAGAGGPYALVTSGLTTGAYTDTGLVNGTPYYYVVRTVDLRGAESGNSNEATATPVVDVTPPATPTGLAVDAGWTRVYVSWAANSEPDLAGYNLYRAAAPGGPFVAVASRLSDTNYVDEGLTNGVTVYYRLTAEDVPGNESAPTAHLGTTPGPYDTTVGLVGYWPMDNTRGTELTDYTATTNHGAFANGSPAWVTGKFGNAMDIDQFRSDHASIPHHAAYNANNTYSMSFWYYPIQGYRDSGMINKGINTVMLSSSNNNAQWSHFGAPWSNTYLGFSLSDTTWHHLVIVYDPSVTNAKQVYVDGALVATDTTPGVGLDPALNTNPIGFNPNNASNGSFRCDDVAIWDRALPIDAIETLWYGGTGRVASTTNPPPAAPTGLVATAGDQVVILSWTANSSDLDLASYSVYRGAGAGGPYTQVASNLTTAAHTDTGLVNGTTYYYVVRSVDVGGAESGDSNEDSATPFVDTVAPGAPTGLTATPGYGRAYLSWDANSEPDLAGYNLYRAAAPGGPFVLIQALVSATTTVDEGLVNDVTVYYRLTAEDLVGNESSASAVAPVTPTSRYDTRLGLVGYWPMDSTAGAQLTDLTVTANHGAVTSGAPEWKPGKFRNAIEFDEAQDDRASIAHHSLYNTNNAYTISFWYYGIFGYRQQGFFTKGNDVVELSSSNHDARWSHFGQPWSNTSLGFELRDTTWHHIMLVYDADDPGYGKRVYVDGSLVASNITFGASDTALNTQAIWLNQSGQGSFRVDDLAVWNRVLPIDAIEYLWNGGTGRPVTIRGSVIRVR
jgi:fibronectin type 3 domain-containing protein